MNMQKRMVGMSLVALAAGCVGQAASDSQAGQQSRDENGDVSSVSDAEAADFLSTFTPSDREMFADTPEFREIEARRPEQYDGQDKASYAALTGWALKGNLAFQDGLKTEPWFEGDHCALYGKSCDNTWHSQARVTGFDSMSSVYEELNGSCGSYVPLSDGSINAGMPCMLPELTGAKRELPWYLDINTCPNNSTGRQIIRDAALNVQSYVNGYTSVVMYETATPLDPATAIVFYCDSSLPGDVGAQWQVLSPIKLAFGGVVYPGTDFGVEVTDRCETPNRPEKTNKPYTETLDMFYSYEQAYIALGYEQYFESIALCTSNANEATRAWRNIILHELGHHLGLHHDQWQDPDTGIMYGGGTACELMTSFARGFTDSQLAAILDTDVDSSNDQLLVWDEDLSCYQVEGY